MFGGYLRMLERAPLWLCVVLALASTAIWWGLTHAKMPWNANETLVFVVLWSTGAVYSVLVLFRYVRGGRRLAIVAGAGVFSYWLGVQIAYTPFPWVLANTAIAGVLTALLVGYVVARLGRLRLTGRLFAMLAGAGVIGGAVIGWSGGGDPFGAMDPDRIFYREPGEGADEGGWEGVAYVAGHALWQVLTCVALYLSPQDAPEPQAES
ncbi:MAG: hypothetical protein OXH15_10550 [Gammaproteobacteria bacterium]|nr:hypothetical protein [Gammaproteobacteria bacterium]